MHERPVECDEYLGLFKQAQVVQYDSLLQTMTMVKRCEGYYQESINIMDSWYY